MFAEPVGNSCRLTYSYCPVLARARARAMQLALSLSAARRSLPTASGGFTAAGALSGGYI